jgi:hypothetical protein
MKQFGVTSADHGGGKWRGRRIGGLYLIQRGLVTVKTPKGRKSAQLDNSSAAFTARRLLRELAAEEKV